MFHRMLFSKLILICSYAIIGSHGAKRGDRNFLENVPHIQWQDPLVLTPPDPETVPDAPQFHGGSRPSPARPPSSSSPSSNKRPPGSSDESDEFERLQKRLSRITSIKSTKEPVRKIQGPPGDHLNVTRLNRIRADLNELETRLRYVNRQETENREKSSLKNSSLAAALEELFNSNRTATPLKKPKHKNPNDVTVVPLPSDELPDWYVTPPPLPVLANGKFVAPEVPDENPLVTDFAPAGKRLPLFEPLIKRTDSELTNTAFDQAGDSRFKWLIPYQPLRAPQQIFNNGEFPATSSNLRRWR